MTSSAGGAVTSSSSWACGQPLPPDVIEERLHGHIAAQGLDPAKWSGDVSIGVAMAEADDVQFIELVRAADVHMYQRRRTRRAR